MHKRNLTEPEADRELQFLSQATPNWFCPLIGADCEKRCVCYVEAQKVKIDDRFTVYDTFCSNAMFTETEVVMP